MTPQKSLVELPNAFKNKNYALNNTVKIVNTPQRSFNQKPSDISTNRKEQEMGIRLIRRRQK
jgi:hypothetical protein